MKSTIQSLSTLVAALMLALPVIVAAQATEPLSTLPPTPAAQPEVQAVNGLSSHMSAAEAMSALAGDPVAADVLAGEDALSEVSIDVNPTDPNNQVIVGHDAALVTMNTFYTTDGGLTWSPVLIGDATDGLTSTFRFDPSVAFDDDGNVYAAYGARIPNPAGGNQRVVVVCRSTDGGASYSQCTNISTTPDIGGLPGNDKWHLATGPDPAFPAQQNVYIAWTQNITEASGTDQRIVVSRSIDGGATFSAPIIINDPSIAGTKAGNLFADPAVGPNGELYVAWNDITAGQVWIDRSIDGGVTFGTDVLVTSSSAGFKTLIPAQPDRGVGVMPTIDTDRSGGPFDGRIYLAYSDLGGGGAADFDVLVRSSSDGGLTWSAPVVVHDDGGANSQFLPWVDVDQQTGQVVAAWYDARNDVNNKKVEVFLTASNDGGLTWGPNVLVSDSPSDMSVDNPSRYTGNFLEYIGVASLGGTAFPVWADNSESPGDLDYYTDQIYIGTTAPVCDANGPYTAECGLPVALDGSGSSDPEGQALGFAWTGSFTPSPAAGSTPTVVFGSPTGNKVVSLTVTDPDGETDSCQSIAMVLDTLAPQISCNSPATITPPDAPVSFTATATDACEGQSAPVITGYACYKFTKKGKRVNKASSCVLSTAGDTITILDAGGVNTSIEWTTQTTDGNGNTSTLVCGVDVVKP